MYTWRMNSLPSLDMEQIVKQRDCSDGKGLSRVFYQHQVGERYGVWGRYLAIKMLHLQERPHLQLTFYVACRRWGSSGKVQKGPMARSAITIRPDDDAGIFLYI